MVDGRIMDGWIIGLLDGRESGWVSYRRVGWD